MLGLFQSGQHHRLHNAIDVFLCELPEGRSCCFSLIDQAVQVGNSFHTEALTGKRDLNPLLYGFARDHRYPLYTG